MNRIVSYFFFTAIFLQAISHQALSEGNLMKKLYNKPVFEISLSAFNISYIIEVNGSLIHRDLSGDGQISTAFPVNHYMRSGENSLTIHMLPESRGAAFEQNSYVEIGLWVSNSGKDNSRLQLTSIRFDGGESFELFSKNSSPSGKLDSCDGSFNENGDITIFDVKTEQIAEYEGGVILSRTLDIPNSLPLWAFFSSDDIPELEPMSDEEYYRFMDTLLYEYMKVQKALSDKAVDKVLPLFAERNRELDAAFYLDPGTMEKELRESLVNAANDPDLELVELKRDYLDFSLSSNNKLMSLTRTENKSAITFNFKSGFGSQRYNLIFRRENDKWILTR